MKSTKIKVPDRREPIRNWRKVIAWVFAVPTALFGLGALTFYDVLPSLPSGPADEEFLQIAFWHLFATLGIGGFTYHAVLAIDIPRTIAWLKSSDQNNRQRTNGASAQSPDDIGRPTEHRQSIDKSSASEPRTGGVEKPNMKEALEQLERLNALRESGALSEEEFERLKAGVLAQPPEDSSATNDASVQAGGGIDPDIIRKHRIRKSMSGTFYCDGKSFDTIEDAVEYAKTLE